MEAVTAFFDLKTPAILYPDRVVVVLAVRGNLKSGPGMLS